MFISLTIALGGKQIKQQAPSSNQDFADCNNNYDMPE
jgi:hypothetical protein